ncbi:hybrid sensor histidine kinase/response regulator [Methylosinus sporium]|uniref:Chemotaxis protein CheA n=1 Tax=Methylosinus sporium TaxID=428 RepID=A0A2U1SRF9_METSR|nr:chemotaxis protein CheW [Methylosinus sporium]PWB94173.1 hybrid sensor histidine kinase/response regulator [Methylosinus sporium]
MASTLLMRPEIDDAMDELLNDFLVETAEHIDAATMELVCLEKDPSDRALIASLFRHVHTIKGTSGFLKLPRVGRLTHSTEALIGALRDGAPVRASHVTLIFAAVDRLKDILAEMGRSEEEPAGDDEELVVALEDATRRARLGEAEPPAAEIAETDLAAPLAEPRAAQPPNEAHAAGVAHIGETVRVSVNVLDRLMGIVSELVSTRNRLLELSSAWAGGDEAMSSTVQTLSNITSDLQDAVMSARMQPVGRLFSTLPRLVRDLAHDLGKKIVITTEGSDTELDRQVIELIRAPLTHIIRNSADHGIEPPAERARIGKNETGVITVRAAYDAGQIIIDIADDGRGLDVARIHAKALANGLVGEADISKFTDSELFEFVFTPGFSTADGVTKVSGRGVGMDVVRENIQSIGGSVSLTSRYGRGACVTLRIPLTLAITPALILTSNGSRFAIPQMTVVELVGVGDGFEHAIQYIHDAPVLRLRNDVLPLLDLSTTLALGRPAEEETRDGFVVVLRVGAARFGLLVETIADVQEVVIEPLVSALARLGVFSGQTILGDGSVVLILDPAALLEHGGLQRLAERPAEAATPEAFTPRAEKTRIILVKAGPGPLKALPLSLVLRIEDVPRERLIPSDGAFVMAYRDSLLPIIPATADVALDRPSSPILVLSGAGQSMGLLIEDIVDVTDEILDLQRESNSPHILGSIQLGGEIVEFLDATYYMRIACPAAVARGVSKRHRILLVDDKAFFRDMLAPILGSAGYEVTTAASAPEALSFLRKGLAVEAVVTDTDMPEMDGYNFARALHELPGLADLPVVALAAQAAPSVLAAAKACGIASVTGKFDRRALIECVGRLLDKADTAPRDLELRIMSELAA